MLSFSYLRFILGFLVSCPCSMGFLVQSIFKNFNKKFTKLSYNNEMHIIFFINLSWKFDHLHFWWELFVWSNHKNNFYIGNFKNLVERNSDRRCSYFVTMCANHKNSSGRWYFFTEFCIWMLNYLVCTWSISSDLYTCI